MSRTTIEIPESTKENLRAARLEHESNYGETIDRLLGQSDIAFMTEAEVETKIKDMVVREALA